MRPDTTPRADFAYCVCQPGAEAALKAEVAERLPAWRLAFSRPGYVTFKLPKPAAVHRFEPPRLTFARTMGLSFQRLDAAADTPAAELAARVWQVAPIAKLAEADTLGLHVWTRDAVLPGQSGAEPGETEASREASDAIRAIAPDGALFIPKPNDESTDETAAADAPDDARDALDNDADAATPEPNPGRAAKRRLRLTLDVAIVEPGQWWVGAHAVRSRTDRWPGGAPRLTLPEHAVSRAHLKMQEALRWASPPAERGDAWVELGCAPGGASQALLDAGMAVVGVDPADVDPILAADPRFAHIRKRAGDARIEELADAPWLAADLNVAPAYTLDAVERIVTHPATRIRGLLLTLKLLSPELAAPEEVAAAIDRVRSWGYADVRTRQLAFNRREYCLAALRTRGQRRQNRKRRAKPRRLAGAAGGTTPPPTESAPERPSGPSAPE